MAWELLSPEEDRGETGGNRGEKIFPSQLSFQRERKFAMVDLNTFSIISKQEVSPAAVFSVEEGGCPSFMVKDKCYTQFSPLIFDLKTKIDITNVLWYCPICLDIPWLAPGGLFVLFKWLYSCCCVLRLAIRIYFHSRMQSLKETEGETTKRELKEVLVVCLNTYAH